MLCLVSGFLCIESCVACLVSSFWIVFRDLCLVACALRHGGLWLVACTVACGLWLVCRVFELVSCLLCLVCWDFCGTCVCFLCVVVVSYFLGVCYDLFRPKIPSWSVPAAGSGVVAKCAHSV